MSNQSADSIVFSLDQMNALKAADKLITYSTGLISDKILFGLKANKIEAQRIISAFTRGKISPKTKLKYGDQPEVSCLSLLQDLKSLGATFTLDSNASDEKKSQVLNKLIRSGCVKFMVKLKTQFADVGVAMYMKNNRLYQIIAAKDSKLLELGSGLPWWIIGDLSDVGKDNDVALASLVKVLTAFKSSSEDLFPSTYRVFLCGVALKRQRIIIKDIIKLGKKDELTNLLGVTEMCSFEDYLISLAELEMAYDDSKMLRAELKKDVISEHLLSNSLYTNVKETMKTKAKQRQEVYKKRRQPTL